METELEQKIFLKKDYNNKKEMEKDIKDYMDKLKSNYPNAIVTKEFYREEGILVRATEVNSHIKNESLERVLELQQEESRIVEIGINGIGENVDRQLKHRGTEERERG